MKLSISIPTFFYLVRLDYCFITLVHLTYLVYFTYLWFRDVINWYLIVLARTLGLLWGSWRFGNFYIDYFLIFRTDFCEVVFKQIVQLLFCYRIFFIFQDWDNLITAFPTHFIKQFLTKVVIFLQRKGKRLKSIDSVLGELWSILDPSLLKILLA